MNVYTYFYSILILHPLRSKKYFSLPPNCSKHILSLKLATQLSRLKPFIRCHLIKICLFGFAKLIFYTDVLFNCDLTTVNRIGILN